MPVQSYIGEAPIRPPAPPPEEEGGSSDPSLLVAGSGAVTLAPAVNTDLNLSPSGTGKTVVPDGLGGVKIGTGDPAFTVSSDPVRYPTAPVALLRPTKVNTGMVLDLMPNGADNACNIDLVNRDLRTVVDPDNWQVARLNIDALGNVIIGASSWGTKAAGGLTVQGNGISLALTTNGGATDSTILTGISSALYLFKPVLFYNDDAVALGASGNRPKSIRVGTDGLTSDGKITVTSGGMLVAGFLDADAFRAGYYVQAGSWLKSGAPIVASLPSASDAGVGARMFVTDASTTLALGIGTTVSGGGANKVPVYSDGSNWIYG